MTDSVEIKSKHVSRTTWLWLLAVLLTPLILAGVAYYGSIAYSAWRLGGRIVWARPDIGGWLDYLGRIDLSLQFELSAIGLLVLFLTIALFRGTVAGWRRSRQQLAGIEGLHGTAHWATADEVAETGLLGTPGMTHEGVFCGGWEDPKTKEIRYLKHNGPEHILGFAPTRTGKGVGWILPTLLDGWRQSALVLDPKGEAWALSSGFRQRELKQRVVPVRSLFRCRKCGSLQPASRSSGGYTTRGCRRTEYRVDRDRPGR